MKNSIRTLLNNFIAIHDKWAAQPNVPHKITTDLLEIKEEILEEMLTDTSMTQVDIDYFNTKLSQLASFHDNVNSDLVLAARESNTRKDFKNIFNRLDGMEGDNGKFDELRNTILNYNKKKALLNIPVITDTHLNYDWNSDSGIKAFAQLCNENFPDFAVHMGDIIAVYDSTKENSTSIFDNVTQMMNEARIPTFYCKGNHDGNGKKNVYDETTGEKLIYKIADNKNPIKGTSPTCIESQASANSITKKRYVFSDDEKFSNTQVYLMTNKKWEDKLIRNTTYEDDTFNEPTGNYFYYEVPDQKIRVIFLNSCYSIEEATAWYYYGQRQIKWFYEKALNFSDKGNDAQNWQVLIFSHMSSQVYAGEWDRVNRAIKAFIAGEDTTTTSANGTNLKQTNDYGDYIVNSSGSQVDVSPTVSMAASINFKTANGGPMKVIAFIHGHTHVDSSNKTNGYNIISVARAYSVKAEYETDQENCYSIFTVDRENSKLYETRIGRGTSREFTY